MLHCVHSYLFSFKILSFASYYYFYCNVDGKKSHRLDTRRTCAVDTFWSTAAPNRHPFKCLHASHRSISGSGRRPTLTSGSLAILQRDHFTVAAPRRLPLLHRQHLHAFDTRRSVVDRAQISSVFLCDVITPTSAEATAIVGGVENATSGLPPVVVSGRRYSVIRVGVAVVVGTPEVVSNVGRVGGSDVIVVLWARRLVARGVILEATVAVAVRLFVV